MIYGLYLSTAGSLAENAKQDINSGNLANVNTPGYKRDQVVFEVRPREIEENNLFPKSVNPLGEQIGGGMWVSRTVTDFSQGALQMTGNPLDVALQGDGFFTVEMEDGSQAYTRAGNFLMDQRGFLTDQHGRRVLSADGGAINVGATNDIYINVEGDIMNGRTREAIGRLGIAQFADNNALRKSGENLFVTEAAPRTAANVQVRGGYVEASTANPLEEMVTMIQGYRAYEANMQMIRMQDATLGIAVRDIARI